MGNFGKKIKTNKKNTKNRHALSDVAYLRLSLKKDKLQPSILNVVCAVCTARAFAWQPDASDIDHIACAARNGAVFRSDLL